jgi:hypothetical protein
MWRRLVSQDICLHGNDIFKENSMYTTAHILAYTIDSQIVDYLGAKLVSNRVTNVHIGPHANDAYEFELALRLFELRAEISLKEYSGTDKFILESISRWNRAIANEEYSSKESNWLHHVRRILSSNQHRSSVISFFRDKESQIVNKN